MPSYPFLQLDVFTRQAFTGNQLAVFTDARGMSTEQMQSLTREMNFSESTFIFPPVTAGAAKQVRIFTPAMELPMAGHPTVGTAAILVKRGLAEPQGGALVLDLGIGPVRVDVDPLAPDAPPDRLPFVWMTHRPPEFSADVPDRAAAAAALGLTEADLIPDLPLEVVSTGVPFLFIPLVSLEAIGRARSDRSALAGLFTGRPPANVALFTPQTVDPAVRFHNRMYAPHLAGITEDPATGSMAAPFGAYTARHGLLPAGQRVTFSLEQGLEMHRPSQIVVEVSRAGDTITALRIGGDSVLVGEGVISWTE